MNKSEFIEMNKQIKTIIFDLDGTLIDSSRDITSAVNYARRHYCLNPLTVHEVIGFVGCGVTHLVEKAIFADSEVKVMEARKIVIDYYNDHLLDETTVYPGIYPLLESLNGDFNLAVATNKPEEMSRQIIKGLRMEKIFEIVIGPESVGKGKPEPDMLKFISEKLKSKPDEIMMIGDSPVDIEAARNFGCRVSAVTWGYNTTEILHESKPHHILHAPMDLLDYL